MEDELVDIARMMFTDGFSAAAIRSTLSQRFALDLSERSVRRLLSLKTHKNRELPPGYTECVASSGNNLKSYVPDDEELARVVQTVCIGLPDSPPENDIYSREIFSGTSQATVWYPQGDKTGTQTYLDHERRSNRDMERLPTW